MKKGIATLLAAGLIVIGTGNLTSTYAAELPMTEIQEVIDNTNYSEIMIISAINGDTVTGLEAEQNRNVKIDKQGLSYPKIKFNDLFLVSKIMTAEAGSYWLSDEWKMAVGEVLLNRVASPEFPNTVEECLYQPGQYYPKSSSYFKRLLPWEKETKLAWRLLEGERHLESSVVFQANFTQGGGIFKSFYDKYLGWTYFCYTSRLELYGE
jgi:hypothetical protein